MFSTLFGYYLRGGGGGPPKGPGHNLLMQFFTLGSSKIQVFETCVFDVVTTQNDHPSYVKHVLGRIYVFFTQFGYYLRGGGGGSQGIGTQPAYALFHYGQLKNGSFWNLCFWCCDHSKWPSKLCKACFRPYLRVFHPIWVLPPGGGGAPKGLVHNLLMLFHPKPLKNRSFRNLTFFIHDHLEWPSKVCKACFSLYLCVIYPIRILRPWMAGGAPKGLVHNLLMQFFTPGSSKIDVSKTYFFDIVVI